MKFVLEHLVAFGVFCAVVLTAQVANAAYVCSVTHDPLDTYGVAGGVIVTISATASCSTKSTCVFCSKDARATGLCSLAGQWTPEALGSLALQLQTARLYQQRLTVSTRLCMNGVTNTCAWAATLE